MIAPFAYQVAGWIGERTNAWIGERAIPGRANVAPPGIRADASPARISSSPVEDDRVDHDSIGCSVEGHASRAEAADPDDQHGPQTPLRHPAGRNDRRGQGCRTGSARARRTSSSGRSHGPRDGVPSGSTTASTIGGLLGRMGSSGTMIARPMYSSRPRPPKKIDTNHSTRTRVGSRSKNSATPPATPARTRLWRQR